LSNTADRLKQELLGDPLRQVSRSFHLSLKFLPAAVREPISLAYLLARTSDTIADSEWLPLEERLEALEQFGKRVAGSAGGTLNLARLSERQGDPAERVLLERSGDSLALLDQLADRDRTLVRQVLTKIISGQELDLKRFAGASGSDVIALSSPGALDDYTYRVAGCVGEFWTRICFAHLTPHCVLDEPGMIDLGVSYGKGLQLVNILRDLPRDLRQGRCYLPANQLSAAGLTPSKLLDPAVEDALRPVYNAWLDQAQKRLEDGWTYTNHYPRSLSRIRISCALPILIGLRTLQRLRTGRVLETAEPIKIPRREVNSLVLQAFLRHPSRFLWNRWVPMTVAER
jgi:farnesyl-diphosphate farnesyltransferase